MVLNNDILLDYINNQTVGTVIKIEKFIKKDNYVLVEYIEKFMNRMVEYKQSYDLNDIQKFIRTKKLKYVLNVE